MARKHIQNAHEKKKGSRNRQLVVCLAHGNTGKQMTLMMTLKIPTTTTKLMIQIERV